MAGILICSGDASGDLHAADFVRAFKQRHPAAQCFGVGGEAMRAAGVELLVHQRELAVGLLDVLTSARRIVRTFRTLQRALRERAPQLVVLVDSPDFNLPFARSVKRAGVPILYYVSPQVWAWRKGRIKKIARRVDRLAVIFPFETEVYEGTGLAVDFVGHPLLDRVRRFQESADRTSCRARLGLTKNDRLMLLMPGSRRNELKHCLPLFLEVARKLHECFPRLRFALPIAPTLERDVVEQAVLATGLPESLQLNVLQEQTYALMQAADLALAKPGTSTMELTLFGCPFVVAGRTTALTWAISRLILDVPSVVMPNLIAGAPVVPELLQHEATPESVAETCVALLDGSAREVQLEHLKRVAAALGEGGAAQKTVAIAEEMIDASART